MAATASRAMTTIAAAALLGGALSACSDSTGENESIIVGGFVASPLGSWYAKSD